MIKRKAACMVFIFIFLTGMISSFGIELARAESAIYINADGSIYPATAPISTTDNVTYTLTGNISSSDYNGVMVERNNTIIDGNGYTLQGSWHLTGIFMTNVSDVTVRNINMINFTCGIDIYFSSNITLSDNNMYHTDVGAELYFSSDNNVADNNITSCRYGLGLVSSSKNILSGNTITNCVRRGILLDDSSDNTVSKNSFAENGANIEFYSTYVPYHTTGNRFLHNNFLPSPEWSGQVVSDGSEQIWDNGVEGNYWSKYNGTDSNQDGIGDTPYVIDENNTDHYPLMGSFQSFNMFAPNHNLEEIDIISNSTFEKVELGISPDAEQYPYFLHLTVHAQNETSGFCRITFPNDLLNSSSYPVYVAGYNATLSRIVESDGTQTTLYFTFSHPTSISDYYIDILPEFPFLLVLLLFMIATPLATTAGRRRHLT